MHTFGTVNTAAGYVAPARITWYECAHPDVQNFELRYAWQLMNIIQCYTLLVWHWDRAYMCAGSMAQTALGAWM